MFSFGSKQGFRAVYPKKMCRFCVALIIWLLSSRLADVGIDIAPKKFFWSNLDQRLGGKNVSQTAKVVRKWASASRFVASTSRNSSARADINAVFGSSVAQM